MDRERTAVAAWRAISCRSFTHHYLQPRFELVSACSGQQCSTPELRFTCRPGQPTRFGRSIPKRNISATATTAKKRLPHDSKRLPPQWWMYIPISALKSAQHDNGRMQTILTIFSIYRSVGIVTTLWGLRIVPIIPTFQQTPETGPHCKRTPPSRGSFNPKPDAQARSELGSGLYAASRARLPARG